MCGIIGVFGREDGPALVGKALASMEGRGKDGCDTWFGKRAAIGHKLHAVVGHVKQPFLGKGVLAANCEIYNWKSLKSGGVPKNDAHRLFLMLEDASENSISEQLDKLSGDYACVYHRDGKVWLARDIVGVKPLFYSLDKGLLVASERKVLDALGAKTTFELHPRTVLCYDIATQEVVKQQRSFFTIGAIPQEVVQETAQLITKAVGMRCLEKFGILFSGGIDSSLVAIVAKKLGYQPTLYTAVIAGADVPESKDLKQAEIMAAEIGLPHKVIPVSLEQLEQCLPKICSTIESSEVFKVGVAIPVFFAAYAAAQDGMKVLLSGSGSDDIFGGYARQNDAYSLQKDCLSNIRNVFEKDTFREDSASMFHSVETRFPYYDKELIAWVLRLSAEQKHAGGKKGILEQVARAFGYEGQLFMKKIATQYGSRADYALGKLAMKNGFGKKKAEYLHSLYEKPNGRIAALVSGGKDSLLTLHIMRQRYFDIGCVISIESENKDSYMFHTPAIELVKLQAESLGIPLVTVKTTGEKEKELEDMQRAFEIAQKTYGIEGISVGAIASTYQRDRVDAVAEKLGLKVFVPLWHKDQSLVLNDVLKQGFTIIMTKVAAEGLGPEWLGVPITDEEVEKIEQLNKKIGLNIAGEGGEYESLVLDMPGFAKKIALNKHTVVSDGNSHTLVVRDASLVEK